MSHPTISHLFKFFCYRLDLSKTDIIVFHRHDLENHTKSTHADRKFKCSTCDKAFPTTEMLAEHRLTHARVGVKGKCAFCTHAVTDEQSFKVHMSDHGNVDLPVQCICCRQTLNSNYEIELHAKYVLYHDSNTIPNISMRLAR